MPSVPKSSHKSRLVGGMSEISLVAVQSIAMVKQEQLKDYVKRKLWLKLHLLMLTLPTNMADLAFMSQLVASPTAAQQAPPKRRRDEKPGTPNLKEQVRTLTSQMRNVMKVVSQHDRDIREFDA